MAAPTFTSLGAFVRLSRPHFLLGGVLMYAMGAVSAVPIDVFAFVVGQLMVTAAQITAHYVNEYADVEPDRAVAERTWFSGGSGVLVDGALPDAVALRAAAVSSIVALLAASVLAFSAPIAAALGVVALSVSWAYSMPPIRLLQTGFGEIATSLVVAVVVPLIGAFAQNGSLQAALWWSVAILFFVHMAMMLAFELPDLESDAASGKRVLAVRIGAHTTAGMITALGVLAASVALVAWLLDEIATVGLIGALAGLLGFIVADVAYRAGRLAALTTAGVAAFVVTGIGLTIGLL